MSPPSLDNSTATSIPSAPNTPQSQTLAIDHGFLMPDFWKMCPYPSGYHKDGDLAAFETRDWFETVSKTRAPPSLSQTVRECYAGELAAHCYNQPVISHPSLRLVSDFLLLLFIMDDLSDLMDDRQAQSFEDTIVSALNTEGNPSVDVDESLAATLVRDWWTRLCLHTPSTSWKVRMKSNIIKCVVSMKQQASIRTSGYLPPLDEFVRHRRFTGGVIPAAAMMEMALGIEFPDEVISHPLMCIMLDCVNDFICFSNDVFSYRMERAASNDTHNIVILLQRLYGMDLQTAVNHVGELCDFAIKTYQEAKARVPSFGPELDKHVAAYCKGLESWLIGNLDWSFIAARYFGGDVASREKIRQTLWVSLKKTANRLS